MAAATHTKEMLGLIDSIDLDKGDYKRLRKAFTTVQDKVGVLGQSLEQEILLTGNAMRGAANGGSLNAPSHAALPCLIAPDATKQAHPSVNHCMRV